MTHGDKKKANKKASKASGSQKKAVKTAKNGKSGKAAKESGGGKKDVKASPKAAETAKKQQTVREKAPAAEKTGAAAKTAGSNNKPKARGVPADPSGFTNPLVGAGFKRALKKFPNAFRRLTD